MRPGPQVKHFWPRDKNMDFQARDNQRTAVGKNLEEDTNQELVDKDREKRITAKYIISSFPVV